MSWARTTAESREKRLAGQTPPTGKDRIVSLIAGYDITVRLPRAAGESHYHFWHSRRDLQYYRRRGGSQGDENGFRYGGKY